MQEFIFTFTQISPLKDHYFVIVAENEGLARAEMFDTFGSKWAFCYKSREEAGVSKFNLQELKR